MAGFSFCFNIIILAGGYARIPLAPKIVEEVGEIKVVAR
jgi:hypothetical protein